MSRSSSRERRKRHRHRSSSSSSSDSSHRPRHRRRSQSPKRYEKIRIEKLKEKMEKKRLKELKKQMETPEEKRLRRLAKKEAKEKKKKEKLGWDEEYASYTNTDNPYGDSNLLKPFVWSKKYEKEGVTDISEEELERRHKKIMEKNKHELESVKRSRQERERELAYREQEEAQLQREKEASKFREWEMQEDEFMLKQAQMRSKIRVQEGRAKPIDLLSRYIEAQSEENEEDDNLAMMNEPYFYLEGLSTQDLEDLQEDIKVCKQLEKGKNTAYWSDLEIIVKTELQLKNESRSGINAAVLPDLENIFRSRGPQELNAMLAHAEGKLNSEEPGIDIGYWETILSRLRAFLARARLREMHRENLQKKLQQLQKEQGVQSKPLFPIAKPSTSKVEPPVVAPDEPIPKPTKQIDPEENEEEEEYEAGLYSPRLIPQSSVEPGTIFVTPEEDLERLLYLRSKICGIEFTAEQDKEESHAGGAEESSSGSLKDEPKSAMEAGPFSSRRAEQEFEKQATKGMDSNEANFTEEFSVVTKTHLWSDKYRPRKPRYFNRVTTGYEWNKYNQTHYDQDNPPPKVVQGYKFNIFYPDLIDKSATPQYTVKPCADNPDFAIIHFHAGPPYEDIAFKIVNREWEHSYKRGYRCQFYNDILQLWFQFKRYRYRR